MNFRNDFFIKTLIMSVFIDNNFRYPEDDIGLTIINGDIARLELMIQHLKELKEIITKKMTKTQIKDVVEQPKSNTRYRPKSTQQIDDLDEPVSKTQLVEQPKSATRYRPKSTQQIDDLDESISKTQPVEQPKSNTRYRPKSTQQIDDLDEPVSKTQPVDYFDDDLDL